MNAYKAMAHSCRKLAEKEPDARLDEQIKVYDFLSGCSDGDIYALFNSAAFNDIMRGYVAMAVDGLELDADTKSAEAQTPTEEAEQPTTAATDGKRKRWKLFRGKKRKQ